MNAVSAADDYKFVQKLLTRVNRVGQKRRLTPDEARPLRAVQERWQRDGQRIVLTSAQREALLELVRRIELRVKTEPYPPFL
jgi:hypothetical protein